MIDDKIKYCSVPDKLRPSDIEKRNNVVEELTAISPGEYEYHIINWLMKKNKDTERITQICDGLIKR